MKQYFALTCLLVVSAAMRVPAAEPPPPKTANAAPAPAPVPAPAPTAAAPAKSTAPDRIESTEKVRADSEVSFPVDI